MALTLSTCDPSPVNSLPSQIFGRIQNLASVWLENRRWGRKLRRNVFSPIVVTCLFLAAASLLPCLMPEAGAQGTRVMPPITAEEARMIVEQTPAAPPSRLLGKPLPKSVDLRNELPPVAQQGDGYSQSCVTFATAYYQMSQMVKRFLHPTWDLTNPQYQFSVDFAFQMGGIGFADEVYKVLLQYGCVDMAEMQYNVRNLSHQPTADQFEAAKPYRIGGYAFLWNHGRHTADYDVFPFNNPIENAKAWLADGFVLSVSVGASDLTFPDNHCTPPAFFYDPPNVLQGDTGGHGVAIVGYNDNINPKGKGPDHKGGFLMVNEWGPNWNGEMHGFLWLSYNYVKQFMPDVWIMVPGGSDTPIITGCNFTDSGNGNMFIIHGLNFGSYRRLAQVKFKGFPSVNLNTVAWTNEMITVQSDYSSCPLGSPVVVYNWNGAPSEPFYFDSVTSNGSDGGQ